ncbi:alternate-type signal peptide domain-containing protein [Prescottella defluvii]|uniref:alternate-type signal peptide domain-containing protein n=1 Tax=Prescottella defluvii TaxID=1323361 RepID=UPI000AC82171
MALASVLFTAGCDTGSLGGGSSSSGGTTTAPTTTAPPTEIGGGGNTSGKLALTQVSAPVWSDQNGPIDTASFRIVPGDALIYKASFQLTLSGDGLKARLTTDPVTFTSGGQLTAKLVPQVTTSINGSPLPTGNVVTTAHNGATVEVAATFTFDRQTAGTAGQSAAANFQDIGVHLEQVLP